MALTGILAVCHSIGDTQMSLALATALGKEGIETTFLPIGEAAKKRLSNEKVKKIEWKFENKLALTEDELLDLAEQVEFGKYQAMTVGTPSYTKVEEQCEIPKQLLEKWREKIPTALLNDYAFYDAEHKFAKSKWGKLAERILMPFQGALERLDESMKEKAVVVGHPEIDAARQERLQYLLADAAVSDVSSVSSKLSDFSHTPSPVSSDDEASAPKKLKREPKTEEGLVLYLAAGKAGDEELLTTLTEADLSGIKIKIALHPAATPEYQKKLEEIIANENQIQFLPKNLSKKEKDKHFYEADGVLTVSSTVGTKAAAINKPVAFYNPPGTPYVVGDPEFPSAQVCNNNSQALLSFFDTVRACKLKEAEEIPSTEQTAAQRMAEAVKPLLRPIG